MTEPFRSPPAYRFDLCETVNQLKQRMTRPLPDGAEVYANAPAALYRLVKSLGTSFDALTTLVVIPSDGSANRWIKQEADGASPWAATEISLASVNVTPSGQFQWTALGSTPGSFALASGDSNAFSLSDTTGLLTYHGLTRMMRIAYQVSVLNNGASASVNVHAAVSADGDVPAANTAEHRGAGEQSAVVSNTQVCVIAGERSYLMAPGSTLRLMLRNMNGVQAIGVDFFSLSVAPL